MTFIYNIAKPILKHNVMKIDDKFIQAGTNSFVGSNNQNVNLFAFDADLYNKYISVIEENKKLKVLLHKSIEQLKTKDLVINLLLE